MFVSSVEQMRAMDRRANSNYGINEELLMENAGHAAYDVVCREIGIKGKRFAVVCGIGNNGGDGLVVARKLHSRGSEVAIFIAGDAAKYKGAATENYRIVSRLAIPLRVLGSPQILSDEIGQYDVIIDGLFGTGLARNIEGDLLEIVGIINTCGKIVVSLDIPSGINGDTGRAMGAGVKADYTVAFGLPKTGNVLYPGFEYCGRLFVSNISFPPALYSEESLTTKLNLPPALPPRNSSGHKGTFGDALFISGAPNYYGAPGFASLSFLRAGGGYSRLASPAGVIPFVAVNAPEVVYIPLDQTASGTLSRSNTDTLLEASNKADIVVIGPGLSIEEETSDTIRSLAKLIEKPVIIDGDGITAIAQDVSAIKSRKFPTILTPHIGEMARLTGLSVHEVEEGNLRVLREACSDLNSIIVLKGAHSLIGFPDGKVFINLSGNSGMATAGSGDVLTGTIAAMFGLGLGIEDAVRAGVFVHGLAGDIAKELLGEDGITASDILDALPEAVRRYREEYDKLMKDAYGKVRVI